MLLKYTLPFNKITLNTRGLAGGKGSALGEMFNAHIPVPPGFVILTTCLADSLKNNPKIGEMINSLELKNFKDQKKIERFSQKIRNLIDSLEVPDTVWSAIKKEYTKQFKSQRTLVAVRSSAISEDSSDTSWAGELESFTNVTADDLIKYVKKCWISIFSTRALYYRFERKINFSDFNVAVVVQKMIQSEKAGVCFTANPVSQNRNEMIIEAAYGFGEAVVLSHVTPDRYTIDKSKDLILEIEVNSQVKQLVLNKTRGDKWVKTPKSFSLKQKLQGKEIVKLYQLCKTVEKHFAFPCDIEWAMERKKFYIVQSRPITTLK